MASNNRGPRGQKRANKVKARKKKRPAGRRFGPPNLDALLEAYTESLEVEFDDDHALSISALALTVLDTLEESRPRFSATAWTPDDVHFLLDDAEGLDPDSADASIAAAISFLTFLGDSGRWSGSPENLEHCLEDLTDFLYDDDSTASRIERPDVDPDVELAALTALPVITLFDEILESVGTPVMGTQIPDLGPDRTRSWESAVDAGLLETASARAYRGPAADSFGTRDLAAVRAAAAAFIARSFVGYVGPGEALVNLATRITFELVLTAMTDDPPTRPEDTGVEFEDLALNVVRNRLDMFVDEKWLEFDGQYRVPVALHPAVLDGLDEYDRTLYSRPAHRFTVTATVDDSDPPQWRRLVLDSALRLDEFHHVLRAAFGDKHSPAHQFTSPAIEGEDEPFAPDKDVERSVPVEGMIDVIGDTMSYVGDGGAYTITLDAIDEFDESSPPAQCVDGGPTGVDLAASDAAVQHLFDD